MTTMSMQGVSIPMAPQTVCSPQQWAAYLPVARAASTPAVWAAVVAEVPSLEARPATGAAS